MKVRVTPFVIGRLSIVTEEKVQGLEDMEIRGQVETIQIAALLRLARIPRIFLDVTCFHLDSSVKLSSNTGEKTLK